MLRTLKDDEGCDHECPLCGRVLYTGTCRCGGRHQCLRCGSGNTRMFAESIIVQVWYNGKLIGREHTKVIDLCPKCADLAFEQQNDDAKVS